MIQSDARQQTATGHCSNRHLLGIRMFFLLFAAFFLVLHCGVTLADVESTASRSGAAVAASPLPVGPVGEEGNAARQQQQLANPNAAVSCSVIPLTHWGNHSNSYPAAFSIKWGWVLLVSTTTVAFIQPVVGTWSLLAGSPEPSASGPIDGVGAAARFVSISDAMIDDPRNRLLIFDSSMLRDTALYGTAVSTLFGVPLQSTEIDGGKVTARLKVDATGSMSVLTSVLYFFAKGSSCLRRIDFGSTPAHVRSFIGQCSAPGPVSGNRNTSLIGEVFAMVVHEVPAPTRVFFADDTGLYRVLNDIVSSVTYSSPTSLNFAAIATLEVSPILDLAQPLVMAFRMPSERCNLFFLDPDTGNVTAARNPVTVPASECVSLHLTVGAPGVIYAASSTLVGDTPTIVPWSMNTCQESAELIGNVTLNSLSTAAPIVAPATTIDSSQEANATDAAAPSPVPTTMLKVNQERRTWLTVGLVVLTALGVGLVIALVVSYRRCKKASESTGTPSANQADSAVVIVRGSSTSFSPDTVIIGVPPAPVSVGSGAAELRCMHQAAPSTELCAGSGPATQLQLPSSRRAAYKPSMAANEASPVSSGNWSSGR